MDKKIAIGAAIIMLVAAGGVFADDFQSPANDTNNSTNITEQNSTNVSNLNTTNDGTNNTQGDDSISDTNTGSTTSQTETAKTGTGATTTSTSTEDAWKSNPKIKVNPAGHGNQGSPMVRNGTVVSK